MVLNLGLPGSFFDDTLAKLKYNRFVPIINLRHKRSIKAAEDGQRFIKQIILKARMSTFISCHF
jgi:hypothetical protein